MSPSVKPSPPHAPGQRLSHLLPWLNEPAPDAYVHPATVVARWATQGRRAIRRFVTSFDGSASSGHIARFRARRGIPRFLLDPASAWTIDDETLLGLHIELCQWLNAVTGRGGLEALTTQSLHFGVSATASARGSYQLLVGGAPADVVRFLVAAHVLTDERLIGKLLRCDAPLRRPTRGRPKRGSVRPKGTCDKFFIRGARGPEGTTCSSACDGGAFRAKQQRKNAEEDAQRREDERREREERERARRRRH